MRCPRCGDDDNDGPGPCSCGYLPRPARRRPSPWQKIMRAAERGTGLKLDHGEVHMLSRDELIYRKATNDDDRDAGGTGDCF